MIGDRRHMRKARYVGKLKDRLWTGAPALTAEGALADGKIERRPVAEKADDMRRTRLHAAAAFDHARA